MNGITFSAIGIIYSPYKERVGIPRQAVGATGIQGVIEIFPEYLEGLKDLEGFSHLAVIFYLHLIEEAQLTAQPPWDSESHGVFATCSPFRPNPIGISIVKLTRIEAAKLYISGIDMADNTPVLDIKPYIPQLYPQENISVGWMTDKVELMTESISGSG